jgi:hypothetical protein
LINLAKEDVRIKGFDLLRALCGLCERIGDILVYLTRLSDKLGIDPLGAAKDKIKINNKKYPVEMAKGSARKYNEG